MLGSQGNPISQMLLSAFIPGIISFSKSKKQNRFFNLERKTAINTQKTPL